MQFVLAFRIKHTDDVGEAFFYFESSDVLLVFDSVGLSHRLNVGVYERILMFARISHLNTV